MLKRANMQCFIISKSILASYHIILLFYKNRNTIPIQQNAFVNNYHCALEQEEPML